MNELMVFAILSMYRKASQFDEVSFAAGVYCFALANCFVSRSYGDRLAGASNTRFPSLKALTAYLTGISDHSMQPEPVSLW